MINKWKIEKELKTECFIPVLWREDKILDQFCFALLGTLSSPYVPVVVRLAALQDALRWSYDSKRS